MAYLLLRQGNLPEFLRLPEKQGLFRRNLRPISGWLRPTFYPGRDILILLTGGGQWQYIWI